MSDRSEIRLDSLLTIEYPSKVLQAYEGTPVPCVLLVGQGTESFQLLSIILEGFGYRVLTSRDCDDLPGVLHQQTICAAVVDSTTSNSAEIVRLVREQGDWPIVLLRDENSRSESGSRIQTDARAFLSIQAEPEAILSALKNVLVEFTSRNTSKPTDVPAVSVSVDQS